jgi:CRISPR-associated protein Cmr1
MTRDLAAGRTQYTIRFVTPAFLGDANQASEFRVPPFKHLLREWWRIGQDVALKTDHTKLRAQEGALFGDALDGRSIRSRVSIALRAWSPGKLESWSGDKRVFHPEVDRAIPNQEIGSQLYLGYGPLNVGTRLKKRPAIEDDQQVEIRFRVPVEAHLHDTLTLWHVFGTIGGRSRNGWGSFEVLDDQKRGLVDVTTIPKLSAVIAIQRPWEACFDQEWSHALGTDAEGQALLWRTTVLYPTWQDVMRALAEAKIALRTALFVTRAFDERHLLALPVTNHPRNDKRRLANQLFFKVLREGHQYRGIVFHMPHRLPSEIKAGLPADTTAILAGGPSVADWLVWQKGVWSKVHTELKNMKLLERWT